MLTSCVSHDISQNPLVKLYNNKSVWNVRPPVIIVQVLQGQTILKHINNVLLFNIFNGTTELRLRSENSSAFFVRRYCTSREWSLRCYEMTDSRCWHFGPRKSVGHWHFWWPMQLPPFKQGGSQTGLQSGTVDHSTFPGVHSPFLQNTLATVDESGNWCPSMQLMVQALEKNVHDVVFLESFFFPPQTVKH